MNKKYNTYKFRASGLKSQGRHMSTDYFAMFIMIRMGIIKIKLHSIELRKLNTRIFKVKQYVQFVSIRSNAIPAEVKIHTSIDFIKNAETNDKAHPKWHFS